MERVHVMVIRHMVTTIISYTHYIHIHIHIYIYIFFFLKRVTRRYSDMENDRRQIFSPNIGPDFGSHRVGSESSSKMFGQTAQTRCSSTNALCILKQTKKGGRKINVKREEKAYALWRSTRVILFVLI